MSQQPFFSLDKPRFRDNVLNMAILIFFMGLSCVLYPLIRIAAKYGMGEDAVDRWLSDQTPISIARVQGMIMFGILLMVVAGTIQ